MRSLCLPGPAAQNWFAPRLSERALACGAFVPGIGLSRVAEGRPMRQRERAHESQWEAITRIDDVEIPFRRIPPKRGYRFVLPPCPEISNPPLSLSSSLSPLLPPPSYFFPPFSLPLSHNNDLHLFFLFLSSHQTLTKGKGYYSSPNSLTSIFVPFHRF